MKLLVGRHAFATMSFIAEIFIFLYVGMDALDKWKMVTTTLVPPASLWCFSCLFFLWSGWQLQYLTKFCNVAVWVHRLDFSASCWFFSWWVEQHVYSIIQPFIITCGNLQIPRSVFTNRYQPCHWTFMKQLC